jgi:GntR family transcriptional regulator, transcriptional repressor for pyruvate dehydrogenase complex
VTPSHSKVFLNTLDKIRKIIQDDQLGVGDKIPSERELADRLSVGRSSVREALRALELLGIIETRRGEGTYIKDVRENDLIPLLGTFILQDTKAKKDLLAMNDLLEKNALLLLLKKRPLQELSHLKKDIHKVDRNTIMSKLLMLTDNYLLYRIWSVLNQYVQALLPSSPAINDQIMEKLIDCLIKQDEQGLYDAYEHLSLKNWKNK